MLLVVDINPYLERKFSGSDFRKGKTSYGNKVEIEAAGIGVEMAERASALNEDIALLSFLGGSNGDVFGKKLMSSNIRLFHENLRDETQEAITLLEKNKTTKIFSKEPRLTREDVTDFYDLYRRKVASFDGILLSPNSRVETPENMENALIHFARNMGAPVFVKMNKENQVSVLEAKPYGIVLGREELNEILGRPVTFIGEVAEALREIFGLEIPYVIVTGSKKGALLFHKGELFMAKFQDNQEMDLDANLVLVGMGMAVKRKYSPEMLLQLSVATGNREDLGGDFADLKGRFNQMKVERLEV